LQESYGVNAYLVKAKPYLGFYKISDYFEAEAFVHKSTIISSPRPRQPAALPTLLQCSCMAIWEIYDHPSTSLWYAVHTPYTIGNNNIV